MGKVLTVMKVYPAEEVDIDGLASALFKIKGCVSAKVEEFAFGIKIIKAGFVCEDKEGTDFEALVKKVEGVSEVQVDEVSLIS